MGLFDGRMSLPRIEALDLRRSWPVVPGEPRPCADCGRLTRAGERCVRCQVGYLCVRCQIVHRIASGLDVSPEDVWRGIPERCPWLLDLLEDEREALASEERAPEREAAATGRSPMEAT